MDEMDDIKQCFFTESAELMVDMEERLLKLDITKQDKEELNAIFRCAHSIKGGSGAFGFDAIMNFTHKMEALLDAMREGRVAPSRDAVDILLKSVDIVKQMLDAARENTNVPAGLGAQVIAELEGLVQGRAVSPVAAAAMTTPVAAAPVAAVPPTQAFTVTVTAKANLFTSGNEPLLILRQLCSLGEAVVTADTTRVPPLAELKTDQCLLAWTITIKGTTEEAINDTFAFVGDACDVKIARETPAPAAAPAATAKPEENASAKAAPVATTTSIRVDLEKVDRLVNMVGELVITEAMLRAQIRHLPLDQFTGLQHGVDELSHHTRELQEAVMAVRMQPVKSVFSRMPRIVRDTSAQLGKDIQLILSGENTEVDKTVIEQLADPLTHMIRNSVDHGIETPDQRAWNDKPLQGTIHLSAGQRSGRIIIEISDDGKGIDRAKVLSKAKEKGLVAADAQLTDEEIDHLVFMAGFSTAEKVTAVSGRGVGMDVVRRNIESLGGTVRITNNPGKGSTFTVSLPLTLAILDGMIVRVGTESYIIPITNIIETMRPKREEIRRVEGRGDVIEVRGEFVPLLYLSRMFDIPDNNNDSLQTLVVLVESGRGKMGLVVNELIGQQQVVIKSLEANSEPVKGISGATILGDGKVSLILEISELKALCQGHIDYSMMKAA